VVVLKGKVIAFCITAVDPPVNTSQLQTTMTHRGASYFIFPKQTGSRVCVCMCVYSFLQNSAHKLLLFDICNEQNNVRFIAFQVIIYYFSYYFFLFFKKRLKKNLPNNMKGTLRFQNHGT